MVKDMGVYSVGHLGSSTCVPTLVLFPNRGSDGGRRDESRGVRYGPVDDVGIDVLMKEEEEKVTQSR